jgi:hypothetical protein
LDISALDSVIKLINHQDSGDDNDDGENVHHDNDDENDSYDNFVFGGTYFSYNDNY